MIKDVHTEHCCSIHGCKYCDEDCTVYVLGRPQSYPCEMCSYDEEELAELQETVRTRSYYVREKDGLVKKTVSITYSEPK